MRAFDAATQGTATTPTPAQVLSGVSFGAGGNALTGTYTPPTLPPSADVRYGVGNGSLRVPTASQVLSGVLVDATQGNVTLPGAGDVRAGTQYGVSGTGMTGTLAVTPGGSGSGLTTEQAAQLTAIASAVASADQILIAAPYVPTDAPVLVYPAPASSDDQTVVFASLITGGAALPAGRKLIFTPKIPGSLAGGRLVTGDPVSAVTVSGGTFSLTLDRGVQYGVDCPDLFRGRRYFTATGASMDLTAALKS